MELESLTSPKVDFALRGQPTDFSESDWSAIAPTQIECNNWSCVKKQRNSRLVKGKVEPRTGVCDVSRTLYDVVQFSRSGVAFAVYDTQTSVKIAHSIAFAKSCTSRVVL